MSKIERVDTGTAEGKRRAREAIDRQATALKILQLAGNDGARIGSEMIASFEAESLGALANLSGFACAMVGVKYEDTAEILERYAETIAAFCDHWKETISDLAAASRAHQTKRWIKESEAAQ